MIWSKLYSRWKDVSLHPLLAKNLEIKRVRYRKSHDQYNANMMFVYAKETLYVAKEGYIMEEEVLEPSDLARAMEYIVVNGVEGVLQLDQEKTSFELYDTVGIPYYNPEAVRKTDTLALRTMAVLDRRVGRRRLEQLKPLEHPLPQKLMELRASATA